LFGRRFSLLHPLPRNGGGSHVLVVYHHKGVYLRLPIAATDLNHSSTPPLQTKLSVQAVTELITLAQQYRLLCPSSQQPSGSTSAPNADKPLSMS
jgi:hypothetical protein